MEEQKKSEHNSQYKKHQIPPLRSLFEETYRTCKESLLPLFVISILSIVSFVCVSVILLLLTLIYLLLFHNISALIPLVIVDIILLTISIIIIGLISQVATIIVIDSSGRIPVFEAIKKSYPFLLPFFIIDVLTGLVTLGGYFLLILPGILFAIFFVFTPYEVILGNHRGFTALRNSYHMVKTHFGEVFVRILLICLLQTAIQFLPRIIPQDQMGLHVIVGILSFIISILFGWFISVYFVLLYKQVTAATNMVEKTSLTWIYIISAIGWIMGIIIVASVITLLVTLSQSGQLQKIMHQYHMISPQRPSPSQFPFQKHSPLKNAV